MKPREEDPLADKDNKEEEENDKEEEVEKELRENTMEETQPRKNNVATTEEQ